MKLYLLFLSLFLNCINLDELKNAEPMHYLTGVIVASVRGAQTSSSDQASFQIQGTLKDSSGNPIANAILSLGISQSIVSREAVTTSTTTDANGNYTLNLKMGNFSVKVTNSSGVEIGSFRMNATSTTTKPEISVTSGNMSFVVNSITSPSPISPVTVAPSNLSYSSSTLNLTVGTAMTSLSPTVTGIVTSYKVSPALPSGLSLNSSTGVISGTPTSAQSAIGYVITASNTGGSSTYPITISASNSQINPSPPSNLTYSSSFLTINVGSSVSLSPTVTGIVSSYSISPTTLPNGLNFNTNSGLLSGIPSSVTSVSTYTISAINSGGSSKFTLQITVNPSAPSGLSYSVNPLILSIGTSMTELKPTTLGSVDSFTISGNPSTLPSGLSLDSKTGSITGSPTSTQSLTSYTISANNSGGSKTFVLQIKVNPLPPSSFSYSTNSLTLTANTSMNTINPTVSGIVDSYTLITPSSLPNGLSLDSKTGVISGVPTVAQSITSYTLSANNDGGGKAFVLQIKVNPAPPTNFSYQSNSITLTVDNSITQMTPTVTGIVDSYTLVNPSSLPNGLSLDSRTGVISGLPKVVQSLSSYTLSANNEGGSKTFVLQIKINPIAPSNFSYQLNSITLTVGIPMSELKPVINGLVDSFTLVSNNSSSLPSGLNLDYKTGFISGTPTSAQPNTSYTLSANNVSGSKTFVIQILITPPPVIRNWATFRDLVDGTVEVTVNPGNFGGQTYSSQKLYFAKCSHGQTYNQTFNFCTGTAITSKYCNTSDNSCNGENINYPVSLGSLYNVCSGIILGGKTGWRVPTKNELKLLINCNNLNELPVDGQSCSNSNPPNINNLFPNTIPSNYWTATPLGFGASYYLLFSDGGLYSGGKTESFYIRCVNSSISNLAYPLNSVTLSVGATMTSLSPTITGSVSSYSISPSLPSGLNLNTTTGVISGTPTIIRSTTNYTITASNIDGSTTFNLKVTVTPPKVIRNWATFTDMVDGTVKVEVNAGTFGGQNYNSQTLFFAKCSHGQVYNQDSNTCTGTAIKVEFCNQNTNYCNGNFSSYPVASGSLFNACNSLNTINPTIGNRINWRVPTKNELKLLINCSDTSLLPTDTSMCSQPQDNVPTINDLFPNTLFDFYWSSDTVPERIDRAWILSFGVFGGNIGFDSKTTKRYVRCVSNL